MRVALVSCVKSKLVRPARAKDLYVSPLFRALRKYAEANADEWYILSAEYGLVHPDRLIHPYERTLASLGKAQRQQWAEKVREDLIERLPLRADVIVLAGERYREGLVSFLRLRGHSVSIPLEGLSLGRQLQNLKMLNRQL